MTARMQTRRHDLGDVEIAYSEVPGAEPAIVLLHGFTGHRDDFAPQLEDLSAAAGGLRILVPDLRGHGDSTHSGDAATFGFERFIDDLVAFLDGAGVERCHLLGHSFGGMVAVRFALAHPRRLASLVLMSTSPFAPDGYARETFEKAGDIALSRGMAFLQSLVEKASRSREGGASDRQIAKWAEAYWPHHRHRYRVMDPVCYRALGIAMMEQTNVEPRLSEIVCPTTVIIGLDDEEFLRGADALARGIPNAVKVELRDAGHHPHREDTAGWLAAMREHVARATSPGR